MCAFANCHWLNGHSGGSLIGMNETLSKLFTRAAQWIALQSGQPATFAFALFMVLVWGAVGPVFGFSNTWQLVINTATTIITFLMVFLIQSSQNRDSAAVQLKLDELIRVNVAARNRLLVLEDLPEEELQRLKKEFGVAAGQAQPETGCR